MPTYKRSSLENNSTNTNKKAKMVSNANYDTAVPVRFATPGAFIPYFEAMLKSYGMSLNKIFDKWVKKQILVIELNVNTANIFTIFDKIITCLKAVGSLVKTNKAFHDSFHQIEPTLRFKLTLSPESRKFVDAAIKLYGEVDAFIDMAINTIQQSDEHGARFAIHELETNIITAAKKALDNDIVVQSEDSICKNKSYRPSSKMVSSIFKFRMFRNPIRDLNSLRTDIHQYLMYYVWSHKLEINELMEFTNPEMHYVLTDYVLRKIPHTLQVIKNFNGLNIYRPSSSMTNTEHLRSWRVIAFQTYFTKLFFSQVMSPATQENVRFTWTYKELYRISQLAEKIRAVTPLTSYPIYDLDTIRSYAENRSHWKHIKNELGLKEQLEFREHVCKLVRLLEAACKIIPSNKHYYDHWELDFM